MHKKNGKSCMTRAAVRFAACILCIQMIAFSAIAQEDASIPTITLSWTDSQGNLGFAVASSSLTDDMGQIFWVQVAVDAPLEQLTISYQSPANHTYIFDPSEGSTLLNVADAGTSMDVTTAITVSAYENDILAATYLLFVSTQVMPEPTPEDIPANVTIIYQYEDGTVIDQQAVSYNTGSYTIVPSSSFVSGLELMSEGSVNLNVANGAASVNPVYFTYKKPDIEVDIQVIYQYEDGTVIEQQTERHGSGSYTIVPSSSLVSGLELASEGSINVDVANGAASVNPVYFTYRSPVVEPKSATVIVYYVDADNNTIAPSQMLELAEGLHTITASPEADLENYSIASEQNVTVEVNSEGSASPASVTFTYNKIEEIEPEIVPGTVIVYYRDAADNHEVATAQTMTLPGNATTPIEAAPLDLSDGYVLNGETTQNVTVDAQGNADPAEIIFLYTKQATEAPTEAPTAIPTATPTETITEAPTVELTTNPTEAPTEAVTENPQSPLTASITIRYLDPKGSELAVEERAAEAGSTLSIAPDPAKIPDGYIALHAEPVSVTVNAEGVADISEISFYYQLQIEETPIPTGTLINRWGYTNTNSVNVRDQTSTGGRRLVQLKQNTHVWLIQEETGSDGDGWTKVLIDGQEGYIKSEFLDVLSQAESDYYTTSTQITPVPEVTSVPTATSASEAETKTVAPMPTATSVPTETATATLTATATATAMPTATATPTEASTVSSTPTITPTENPTETPALYSGYALTNQQTALRTGADYQDTSIIDTLSANTLVSVQGQYYDNTGTTWSYVQTTGGVAGMVVDSSLTRISNAEASAYIEANATPTPSPSAEPTQQRGYAVARGDNVYMRTLPSDVSGIINVLTAGTVVYVSGQEFIATASDQYEIWHVVRYNDQWGYIRSDLLRMLSSDEEVVYLESLGTATPIPATTPQPYDENNLSSYGYVSSSSVNFRQSASTSSTRLAVLKQYAFCLVLGSTDVNGVTWYNIKYGNTTGYVQGNYFKQLTIAELEDFLTSEEYKTGIANNSSSSSTTSGTFTSSGTSSLISAEDQTVTEWTNPNSGLNVSYEPFDPFATVAPLTSASPTVSATETVSAAATTIEPIETIDVEYPTEEPTSGGGSGTGWLIAAAVVLLGGGGGGYAYMLHKQNQRKAAQRAAQRRAAAQRTGSTGASGKAYARTSGTSQPRTGTYNYNSTHVSSSGSAAQRAPGGAVGAYGTQASARRSYAGGSTSSPGNSTYGSNPAGPGYSAGGNPSSSNYSNSGDVSSGSNTAGSSASSYGTARRSGLTGASSYGSNAETSGTSQSSSYGNVPLGESNVSGSTNDSTEYSSGRASDYGMQHRGQTARRTRTQNSNRAAQEDETDL